MVNPPGNHRRWIASRASANAAWGQAGSPRYSLFNSAAPVPGGNGSEAAVHERDMMPEDPGTPYEFDPQRRGMGVARAAGPVLAPVRRPGLRRFVPPGLASNYGEKGQVILDAPPRAPACPNSASRREGARFWLSFSMLSPDRAAERPD